MNDKANPIQQNQKASAASAGKVDMGSAVDQLAFADHRTEASAQRKLADLAKGAGPSAQLKSIQKYYPPNKANIAFQNTPATGLLIPFKRKVKNLPISYQFKGYCNW